MNPTDIRANSLPCPARIASLLAGATELVCALGAGDRLVARSHECDHPEWVARLPVGSRPTFEVALSSRDIDARVRETLRSGQPLYAVDDALLATLSPDLLITQTHCNVCAVSPADVGRGSAPPLLGAQVVVLAAGTLEGILGDFRRVADALGLADAGGRLVTRIRRRLTETRSRVARLPRRTVACLEWIDPVFPVGNWGPELVEHAGGICLLGRAGEHSRAITWDELLRADPDVLIVAPCGFRIERTLTEMHALARNAGWESLRAVREDRVFVADGNLYFNRSGPSLFESVDVLTEILHPQEFPPRHEGRVWQRFRPVLGEAAAESAG